MKIAIKLAKKAAKIGEIPVGAVIVKSGKVIAKAYNKREKKQLATAHAEIAAINRACKKLRSWRLDGCQIYVTLEPCLMCLGAILNARIDKLYYGCGDDKRKGLTDSLKCAGENGLNHNLEVVGGIEKDECCALLKEFFETKRQNSKTKD